MLITYFYKERVIHNDLLNRSALRIIKYGVAIFFIGSTFILVRNDCTTRNNYETKTQSTEFLKCVGLNRYSILMFSFGLANLVLTILLSLCYLSHKKFCPRT